MDNSFVIGCMKVRIRTQSAQTPRRERRSKQTCVIYARWAMTRCPLAIFKNYINRAGIVA